MALLEVPATKSALLALRRQLVFSEEGYALLEQKRELLLLELQARRPRAAEARRRADAGLAAAFAALREALLDSGAEAVDVAALGAPPPGSMRCSGRRLMGVGVPDSLFTPEPAGPAFGPGVPSAAAALARRRFLELLPGLAELAGLEIAVRRLERELRKTQRRCNALSKKLIPDCRDTIRFLAGSLEERERESYVILKMIRDRLRTEG
jgi:V/A-type H+-transporting ATPase subunit D